MFTRLRQPSWSTAVAGWSSIRILSPSQWGWSCSLGWCPAQQPAPSLPSHATPDTARNSRHQWPHGSGQCCSLSLISWRFSLSQLLQGSLKRLYESQLGSNDVPVTVCRSGAQSTIEDVRRGKVEDCFHFRAKHKFLLPTSLPTPPASATCSTPLQLQP